MNYYDIEKIYDEMEQYLIDNIKKNLMSDLSSFHLKEEKKLGFNWEAWQTTKLRELKRYRKENKNILNKYVNNIDSDIKEVLRREYQQGKKSAYKGFKLALKEGFKSSVKVKDSFFRINDRKLDALIKSVNNDFKKANQAVLRMTNDTYRQVIFEASMYNNTGVMTSEEAIRKAVGQFEQRGINSIEYSNGSRHRISEYTRMAIRTASTRAYLQGNGEFRKKIGQTLVILSKHGTACKLCQPWEGRVLIDDVYSGGTKNDGKYPLLSDAMKQGLYHPNCRHALGTYYPELSKKDNVEITEKVEKEELPTKIVKQKVETPKNDVLSKLKDKLDKQAKPIPMSEYDYETLAYKLRDEGYLKKDLLDTRRYGYDGEDLTTKKLLYDNKYNELPVLLDAKDFDNLGDDYIKVYRGVKDTGGLTAKEINEQFRSGDLYIGKGLFGNGTYTAINKEIADGYGTDILEIAIPKNARIVNYDDIENELMSNLSNPNLNRPSNWKPINSRIYDFTNEGVEYNSFGYDYSKAKFTREEADGLRTLLNDETFKAVSCNYDIIEVNPKKWYRVMTDEARKEVDKLGFEKKPYYVILNRGSVIVKR